MTSVPCNSWVTLMSFESAANRQQDKAYVLHTRAYKNTSLIIEVMSREHGRMTLVAKGAKRIKSPFQGLLQPFIPLFIAWGGRNEMKTLYTAEAIPGPCKFSGDLIYTGFYINELIIYLLHQHEAHAALFDHYQDCLNKLQQGNDTELVLRYFELALLGELGYGVSLDHDLQTGEPVLPGNMYEYNMEMGVTELSGDTTTSFCVSGETLLALATLNISTDQQKLEAKKLLRSILEYHLEGRPLKTRELFMNKKKISLSL